MAAAADGAIVIISMVISYAVHHHFSFANVDELSKYAGVGILFAAIFVLLLFARGSYRATELIRVRRQLVRVVCYGSGLTALFAFVGFLMQVGDDFSRMTILMFLVICSLCLIMMRVFWSDWIPYAMSRGIFNPKRFVLICIQGYPVGELRERIQDSGAVITHVIDMPPSADAKGWIEGLNANIAHNADEILVVCDSMDLGAVRHLLDELRMLPMPVKLALDPVLASIASCPSTTLGGVPAVEVQRQPLSMLERTSKRCFDIVFALCALFVLSPLMIITAISIKLDDRGPVLFRQHRRGCNNTPFRIAKFRSMFVRSETDEVVQASRGDARVTRVGGMIRSTSIDELPQLWNVLCGQMSVVGPRPHAVVHDDRYDQLIARYAFRRHVKPGITGWAQINGLRGETPTLDLMEARLAHDLWYIHNWSLWLDLKIVILTCFALRDRSNTY